ncbi:hypothetical protein ASF11_02830 [Acidovorax sp. Leaf76]|nr:hypothetical protein ASF11_02830 [Acidovorax sp. Leaf76]KQS42549.1 hypothetical protein ASG27_01805 [Acidovorax sp. Leaf191]
MAGKVMAVSILTMMAEGETDSDEPLAATMLTRAKPACFAKNSNCQLSERALCLASFTVKIFG